MSLVRVRLYSKHEHGEGLACTSVPRLSQVLQNGLQGGSRASRRWDTSLAEDSCMTGKPWVILQPQFFRDEGVCAIWMTARQSNIVPGPATLNFAQRLNTKFTPELFCRDEVSEKKHK